MKFYDEHTHTNFSPDANLGVKEAVEQVIEINSRYRDKIAGIAFTDHLDLLPPTEPFRFTFDIAEQQAEISRVEGQVEGKMLAPKILRGIELGLQPHSIEATREYISGYEFDVMIASLHFIDRLDPYKGEYFIDKGYKEAFSHAFEQMYNVISEFGDFDILGHFDYVARYSPYEVKEIYYKDFPDELDAILKFLAHNGKALEINTKSYDLHKNGHCQQLDINILRRFREFGGEFVTLGSDAHMALRIGDRFDRLWFQIKSAGFDKLTYFDKRKAILYNPEQ